MKDWPRLTDDLTGPRDPAHCQACGAEGSVEAPDRMIPTLVRWREHDQADRPGARIAVLCRACSGRLIEPHPRLYSELAANQPEPGAMGICLGCRWREGTGCTCPLSRRNGGPGMLVNAPGRVSMHVCRRGKGARSGRVHLWPNPPVACRGREEAAHVAG